MIAPLRDDHPRDRTIAGTGASGFVGNALVRALDAEGYDVMALSRRRPENLPDAVRWREMPDLAPTMDTTGLFDGVSAVVHCAARVHVMDDSAVDPLAEFRAANRDGTLVLAEAARVAAVERFVFVSSIKVNGEASASGRPIHPDDPPAPGDPYGISKLEAEVGLRDLLRHSDTALSIVRPVLVYGRGVRANFAALAKLAASGLPLPFRSVSNARSLVYLGNLVDLLSRLATGRIQSQRDVFLASDAESVSTGYLVRAMAEAQGRRSVQIKVPPRFLAAIARILGKRAFAQRLLGDLVVDRTHLEQAGWSAPFTLHQGLRETFASDER